MQFVYLGGSSSRRRPSIYKPRNEGQNYKAGWSKVELQNGPTRFVYGLIDFVKHLLIYGMIALLNERMIS